MPQPGSGLEWGEVPERGVFAEPGAVVLDAGESIKALSEYLGHSDPGFTPRTYTHLMPNSESRTRRAMDAALTHAGTAASTSAPANPEGTPTEANPSGMCPACAMAA